VLALFEDTPLGVQLPHLWPHLVGFLPFEDPLDGRRPTLVAAIPQFARLLRRQLLRLLFHMQDRIRNIKVLPICHKLQRSSRDLLSGRPMSHNDVLNARNCALSAYDVTLQYLRGSSARASQIGQSSFRTSHHENIRNDKLGFPSIFLRTLLVKEVILACDDLFPGNDKDNSDRES
jgi:hypothetical protein